MSFGNTGRSMRSPEAPDSPLSSAFCANLLALESGDSTSSHEAVYHHILYSKTSENFQRIVQCVTRLQKEFPLAIRGKTRDMMRGAQMSLDMSYQFALLPV
ncbi:hypothetical protein KCU81_g9811, partial [Aureobasidium melanogenum]|uniref:Uncharacterized protein n=1 Tax=Aureobasidium melanogenum (strain CBS 110374) TaxID=1043003 RepID=A0A074VAZ3_AURM1